MDRAGERWVAPAAVLGRDHVHVPVEQQRRQVAAAGRRHPHDQVGAPRRGREHLGLQPRLAHLLGEELDALGLVARRVGGVEADQRPQQLDRLVLLALPVDLAQQRMHRTSRRLGQSVAAILASVAEAARLHGAAGAEPA